MGYADLSAAMYDIGLDPADAEDGEKIARLAMLDDDISRLIDLKTGRSFGGTAAAVERTVQLPPSWGNDTLVLPFAVRSVTSVVITGDWAETLDASSYALTLGTELTGDYHGIRRTDGGSWPAMVGDSVITIEAVWSDTYAGGAPPDEIVAAATFLVVEEWKLRQTSPAGEIGPDGLVVRARNPWSFEIVKTALDHYGVALSMAGF